MKKLISMLSVLVLAIGTMMVTGCGLKDLAAPKDEWCSYTAEMDSVKLDAYFYYATADKSVTIWKCSIKILAAKAIASSGLIEPLVHTSNINLS